MSRKLSVLSALALTALLASCGPDSQEGSSTTLDGDNTTQIAGVIVPQAEVRGEGERTVLINAAKARLPHQYDAHEPLSLFDVNTNLNPASNR